VPIVPTDLASTVAPEAAADAGALDAGATDAGATEAGPADAGALDAGVTDAGAIDAPVELQPAIAATRMVEHATIRIRERMGVPSL